MPQLLRGRRFESHCHPVLQLMVTIDISRNNSGFAPSSFCNRDDSDQRCQCTNLHKASQGALCSALKLGVLQQCLLEPRPAITDAWSAQSTKIVHKHFIWLKKKLLLCHYFKQFKDVLVGGIRPPLFFFSLSELGWHFGIAFESGWPRELMRPQPHTLDIKFH